MKCCNHNCNQGDTCPQRMQRQAAPTAQDASLYELVQDITYWACVAAATVCTVAGALGITSYIYHRWF